MITNSISAEVEQWGIFELALEGSTEGNPFLDTRLSAHFSQEDRSFEVNGFYDGGGVYRVRFMPDTTGTWHYTISSNLKSLNNHEGSFEVSKPGPGNHGPVRVANTLPLRVCRRHALQANRYHLLRLDPSG